MGTYTAILGRTNNHIYTGVGEPLEITIDALHDIKPWAYYYMEECE